MFYGQYEITEVEELKDGLKKYHYIHTDPQGSKIELFEVLSDASAKLLISTEAVTSNTVHDAILHTVKQEVLKVYSKYNIPASMHSEVSSRVFEALKFAQDKIFSEACEGQGSLKVGIGYMMSKAKMDDYI